MILILLSVKVLINKTGARGGKNMTTLLSPKVTISGYFFRIFQRRSDPVRGLALKVRRGQERSFRDLHAAYQAFDRSHNPECSRALAKEIVNVATWEVGPGETLAKKIEQVTAATLSNWVRDRKRNALVSDIYTEMQESIHRQERINRQEALKAPLTREFKRFLLDVQGGRAEPITQLLEEKKQAKIEELASDIEFWESEWKDCQHELTTLQKSLLPSAQAEEGVMMLKNLSKKASEETVLLQREEDQKALEVKIAHLRNREKDLSDRIRSCMARLDSYILQINEYDLDTIFARGKELVHQAWGKRAAVQAEGVISAIFSEPIIRLLEEKKQAKIEELASDIEFWESEWKDCQHELTILQESLPSEEQAEKASMTLLQKEREEVAQLQLQREEDQKAQEVKIDHLRNQEKDLSDRIRDCGARLKSFMLQINEYDLDTISARGKEIMRQAEEKGIAVQVDDLIPATFSDHSKSALTQALLIGADQSAHSTFEVSPEADQSAHSTFEDNTLDALRSACISALPPRERKKEGAQSQSEVEQSARSSFRTAREGIDQVMASLRTDSQESP